jgi:hypothetical protein
MSTSRKSEHGATHRFPQKTRWRTQSLTPSRPDAAREPLTLLYRYEYVRNFERDEILLPNTWIVVRIDGRGFHK